ncbi:TniQ family protein [Pseudomonas sp. MAP12]|uniref:TniQ family protein n=1 Tax=Geopseudomonas aromaticivorans TaxID=2849492 RepID=A0ABS6MVU8_9GAMM|nr:TniQ family protein [Pseudomonas aromaticivorans]MBV2132392.1 TniQ family protein [Pseudomonas aromaticivorans]
MLTFISPPAVDESLNGYLLRLAEENYLGSTNALLRPTGVRIKARYTGDDLVSLAQVHGLPPQQLQQLSSYSAIRGSIPAGAFLRKGEIAVCPACLREAGYIRQAWHHELITVCPTHRVQLVDHCPACQAPLELNRAAVCACRCGFDLTGAPAAAADVANLHIASLLMLQPGREIALSGFGEGREMPADIDRFWLFLANLTLSVPQRKNAAIDLARAREINRASYEIAEDLERRFPEFVEARVLAANQRQSSRFIQNLGTWYRELNSAFAGEAYAPLRDMAYRVIVAQANAPINRKLKQIGAEMLGAKSTFTAAEAARQLGSSPDRIVSLVKSGQLAGNILQGASVEFCLVERSAVETEQRAAAGLVAGKDLLKALNISRRVRDRMVECGVLTRVADGDRPLFAKGDYRQEDIQRLLQMLAAACTHTEGRNLLGLEDISGKRFSNQQANELYRLIFAGQIKPVHQLQGITGLAAFQFDHDELNQHLRQGTDLMELTITDLSRITRWKHETIKSWVEAGLLPHRMESRDGKKQIWISVTNLITFLSTYIVAADAAERLNTRSVWMTKGLTRQGVLAKGAHATSEGSLRGLLLSTDALINVASGRDPHWRRNNESAEVIG